MKELIFIVEEAPEGGYLARALGESIFTEADDLPSLHVQVRDAVQCHFEESPPAFHVLVEQDEDGVFVAQVPSLPGCVSQGATRSEVVTNIQEAVEAYLESLRAHGEGLDQLSSAC